ncbi:MAG TPA: divalent metal cation transporter, partial [Candidatus Tumulicola sp.]
MTDVMEVREGGANESLVAIRRRRRVQFVRGFGPGLVSGASANDPTTVGSIAVVAAATGYAMGWLVVLLLPLLAIVQSIAASIATVSQTSLQEAILNTFGRRAAIAAALSVVSVGLFTLAADMQAGAQALAIICRVPYQFFVVPLGLIAGWLLATKSYMRVERILAWFTPVFLCYLASAILARPNWGDVLRGIFMPHISLTPLFLTGAIALLGTTLTGYVYFWESIEVAERRPPPGEAGKMRSDAAIGIVVAGSSFLFILVATAATAGVHHLPMQTAADAAVALKPLAGPAAQILFGIGLLASAAIAVPILAATNGYVVAQTLGLRAGLTCGFGEARAFYGVIFASLFVSSALALAPISTMWLLYWASVAAGIATPVTLVMMMLVAQNRRVMNARPIGALLACGGWVVTGIVSIAAAAFVMSIL